MSNHKISMDELSPELQDMILNGMKPKEIKCRINVSCTDAGSVTGQTVSVKDMNVESVTDYTLSSGLLEIVLKPETGYEISVNSKDGYLPVEKQSILTQSTTDVELSFVYIKDEIPCSVNISCTDGASPSGQIISVKNISSGSTETHTCIGATTNIVLKSQTSYEVSINNKVEYLPVNKQTITTGEIGTPSVINFVYTRDEVTCNVNVSTMQGKPAVGQTLSVKRLSDGNVATHVLAGNTISIKLRSNSQYQLSMNDKVGCMTPDAVSITTKEVNSTISVTFVYRDTTIYGFDIDETNSDPNTSVTYTDDAVGFTPLFAGSGTTDYGSWSDTFVLKGNKPCLLKDGVRQYYLNANDYTKREDGTASDITSGNNGDVMAEFAKAYYKIWKEGNILKFRVSNFKVDDGYCCNAFLSEDGNASEKDFMYIGCYNSTSVSSKMRSLSGKAPWVNHTIATARAQAIANGSGYQQMTLSKLTYIQCLTVLVSKSRDSQTKLGQGRTNTSSAINTGTMNNKGQFWGDQGALNGVKVFHIENFWGNIWQIIDGLVVSSRVTKHKVTGTYSDNGADYINGATVPSSGYVDKIDGTNNGGLIPTAAAGSSSTHYCDYVYTNTGTYVAFFGGHWANASNAGVFYLYLGYTASYSNTGLGSRLSY